MPKEHSEPGAWQGQRAHASCLPSSPHHSGEENLYSLSHACFFFFSFATLLCGVDALCKEEGANKPARKKKARGGGRDENPRDRGLPFPAMEKLVLCNGLDVPVPVPR